MADNRAVATPVPADLTDLASSGGGIRPATLRLGALQALHDMQRLPKIDYLRTVSGGSYIAGSMPAHLGKEQDDSSSTVVQG